MMDATAPVKSAGECLFAAMQDTFETNLFVEVQPLAAEEAHKLVGAEVIEVSVRIGGPVRENISLCITRESAYRLAQGIQPQDHQIDDEMVCDMFAETLNIIAGRYAYNILGFQPSFDLSVPRAIITKCQSFNPRAVTQGFRVDFATVVLSVDSQCLEQGDQHAH